MMIMSLTWYTLISSNSSLHLRTEEDIQWSTASPDQVSAGGQGQHPEGDKNEQHGEPAQRSN